MTRADMEMHEIARRIQACQRRQPGTKHTCTVKRLSTEVQRRLRARGYNVETFTYTEFGCSDDIDAWNCCDCTCEDCTDGYQVTRFKISWVCPYQ